MYCLLCHEKIPRLRAWRTKSEFCCDEHAALYKKQTLERLLVDPGVAMNGPSSLPEPPEPDEFEHEELEPIAASEPVRDSAPAAAKSPSEQPWRTFEMPGAFEEEALEPESPAAEDQADGVDELWRLADEVGDRRGPSARVEYPDLNDRPSDVRRQSAEEALEALRNLARKAAPIPEERPQEPRRPAFEMPPPADLPADQDFDERAVLKEIQDLDDAPEPELRPEPRIEPSQVGSIREDEQDGSILERLMTEPLSLVNERLDNPPAPQQLAEDDAGEIAAPPEPPTFDFDAEDATPADGAEESSSAEGEPIRGEAAEALQELVSELDLGSEAQTLELDAPEPAWGFDDATNELAALKASLVSSGPPPVPYEADASGDLDVLPDEPVWDALDAFELDADIEPPEPELDEAAPIGKTDQSASAPHEEPQAEAPAPLEAPASKAAQNGIAPAARPPQQRTGVSTRFRAVTVFAEVQLELAAEPEEDNRTDFRAPDLKRIEPAAPWLTLFLPAGSSGDQGRCGTWSMHESSVAIEPEASLETSKMAELAPTIAGAPVPFEPGGLFFDMALSGGSARPAAEADAEAEAEAHQHSVPARGRGKRS